MELPAGVTHVRSFQRHTKPIGEIAWSPSGELIASPSEDETVRIWDVETDSCILVREAASRVRAVVFDPSGDRLVVGGEWQSVEVWDAHTGDHVARAPASVTNSLAVHAASGLLASAHDDSKVRLWDLEGLEVRHELEGHERYVMAVAFNPAGTLLASVNDSALWIWDVATGEAVHSTDFSSERRVVPHVGFSPDGGTLALIGGDPAVIELLDPTTGLVARRLEGHLQGVARSVAYSPDGRLLVSAAEDGFVRVWNAVTGVPLTAVKVGGVSSWTPRLAFHPSRPRVAVPGADDEERGEHTSIYVFDLDVDRLLGTEEASVTYASAKIVLVGDSGVGKTGLGWRLAHGDFAEHSSTHGQQFWMLDELRTTRPDGTECEAILWDLAGQPDYRLIHALFVDDADLALVCFDPTRDDDPLHGVEYWLKQLGLPGGHGDGQPGREVLIVAARTDRGTGRLTADELAAFCRQRGVAGHVATSARTGNGLPELIAEMRESLHWERSPVTVTTEVFKLVKQEVLALKERADRGRVILSIGDLREVIEASDVPPFSDAELTATIEHLSKHGYVTRLTTSRGEPRVLLAPDLLNNLASSIVLDARSNPRGLGSLEEAPLLAGDHTFPELDGLPREDRSVLIDSAIVMFLRHNVCFRETDPLSARVFLVFPELINLREPATEEAQLYDDGPAYTAAGQTENVYASLVVLLGYTSTFARTHQWRDHARYLVGEDGVCGFRQQATQDGDVEFVLYFGTSVEEPIRRLFQSLFESFLIRRDLSVRRFDPVQCQNGHRLNRAVVHEHLAAGEDRAFCSRCGAPVDLADSSVELQPSRGEVDEVRSQSVTAGRRAQFEQALFRFAKYVSEAGFAAPDCFVSYAWGVPAHEQWVRTRLAADLGKAGVDVLLDAWDNARIGSSVPRFVERAAAARKVIVVGTPQYRRKYDNEQPTGGYVVAAEGDLVGRRLIGSEAMKSSVLPALLDGDEDSSFPALLQGRVYADFRTDKRYFLTLFDVLLSLYDIPPHDAVCDQLREGLAKSLEHAD